MTVQRWKDGAQQRWGDLAAAGLEAYPAASDAEAEANGNRISSDNMAWMMRMLGQWQCSIGNRVYVYHFVHAAVCGGHATLARAIHVSCLTCSRTTAADGPVLHIASETAVGNSLDPSKVKLYQEIFARQFSGNE